jgi:hypothetical protein
LEAYVSLQHDASAGPVYAIAAVHDISSAKSSTKNCAVQKSLRRRQTAKDEFLANVSHRDSHPMNAHPQD